MEGIRRYPFDNILMAMNAADPHHHSLAEALLPLAVEQQMGIMWMKVPARGRLLATWSPHYGSSSYIQLDVNKEGDHQVIESIGGPGEDRTPDPMVAKHISAVLPTFAAVCEGLPTVAISLMVGIF
ncbi:MAG: hypothetical protein WAO35_18010 [Terriglobia bacterium]